METTVLSKDKDSILISWEDSSGFGQVKLYYSGEGKYTVDAEFIGLDKLLEIFDSLNVNNGSDSFINLIKKYCARYSGTHSSCMNKRTRKGEIVRSRQLTWYILKLNSKMSLTELGDIFKKNHATALHGIRRISGFVDIKYKPIMEALVKIKKQVDERIDFKLDIGL